MRTQTFAPHVSQHFLVRQPAGQKSYTWTMPSVPHFNELLISWNATRPAQGQYVILASVFLQQWSPWLLYAVWGSREQYSFHDTTLHAPVHTFQDQVELLEGQEATGFRIRVEACAGADLDQFSSLYACTTKLNAPKSMLHPPSIPSFELPIQGLSQQCLMHPRSTSLCSPTSAASVIHFLSGFPSPHPLDFAENVYDSGFDIYGNWSFNTAQMFAELGPLWTCYCARMKNFESTLKILKQGFPVILSIKGCLTGSVKPYANGHLIAVRGYDAPTQKVLCMDPAFKTNEETLKAYSFDELMQAWGNRHHLAYVILPNILRKGP